jgi:hypothetical protein
MWPLSLVLLVATAAPQQAAPTPQQAASPQLTAQQKQLLESARQKAVKAANAAENDLLHGTYNTCYTLRSYFFQRQDGQAPMPAGMTTCTPANKFQQKWAATELGLKSRPTDLKIIDQQPSQDSNICYTMRSYSFRRQDGQAPVLVGTTTCTPASKLQQRRVSPEPALYVPMGFEGNDRKPAK